MKPRTLLTSAWLLAAASASAFASAPTPAPALENLLSNPGFAGNSHGGWTDRTSPKQALSVVKAEGLRGEPNALKITVVKDGGTAHGQILQFVKVRPGVEYKLSAWVKGDAANGAYISVKHMQGGKEGARRASKTNAKAGEWEEVALTVATEPGDTHLQFVMRFRMNESCVGKSWLFAAPALAAADGLDAAPPEYEPPKAVEPKVAAPGADSFVTGEGAGAKDGSSWANALPISQLQAAIDRAGPGDTVAVAAGEYAAPSVVFKRGGASLEKPLRLVGVRSADGAAARPALRGGWKPTDPARGSAFVRLEPGASFISVENFELRNVRNAVIANGPNHGLRFKDVDVRECRDAFVFEGGATAALPDSGSSDIVLDGCDATLYTKRHLRTQDGVSRMRVLNCVADAGGPDYAYEVFPVGFHITGNYKSKAAGVADRNIYFENCEARGNWHKAGKAYWNADGWASERGSSDLEFVNCRAFNNTDGGWDLKSQRVKFKDCVSIGNKRNYRVWPGAGADGVVFENCLSAYSRDYGGLGHDVGFWMLSGGSAALENCTSWGDRVPLKIESNANSGQKSQLAVSDSVFGGGGLLLQGDVEQKISNTILPENAPRLRSPEDKMAAPGDAFDCVSMPGAGYKAGRGE